MTFKIAAAALLMGLMLATAAPAAEFTVNMVNKDAAGKTMQFEPAFLRVAVGDTVNFVAVDKGHDSESVAGAIPEGAEGWKGKISQPVSVTFTVPGLYAYKCTPHVGLGMVGLIEVGADAANLEAIKTVKLPSKARTRMDELIVEQAALPVAQ